MSLKYLLPIWQKESEKSLDAFRFAFSLTLTLKTELLRGGESQLEKKALAVSLGDQTWPTDEDMPARLGRSLAVGCLLTACRCCANKGTDEFQAVVYFATREMTYENRMRPNLTSGLDSLARWIAENVRTTSGGTLSMEEMVGSWVLANTLRRELSFADKAFALLIGHKICDACAIWGIEQTLRFGAKAKSV